MRQYPQITDEHIVAYIDGELQVSPEFERELRTDPSLARAADEYAALGKAMHNSRADARFMLSASFDASTKKMLSKALSKSRGEVRTAADAPIASPVRNVPATRNIKFAWAKRASIGLAFATLLAFLYFNITGKSDQQLTQVPVGSGNKVVTPIQPSAPVAPEITAPQPTQLASNASAPETHQVSPAVRTVKNAQSSVSTSDKIENKNLASSSSPVAVAAQEVKADPADIMISHRYAKLIKATRAVEVTDQDRM